MTAYRTKGTVSEDDIYALVQRYGASTIFTLLQEISQATEKDVTIDWRALVKVTSTGISNAREYQMLWRHLAYRDSLEKNDDGGEPLSDESDLEFELEAITNSSKEVSMEVDCCVKVLLSSGSVGDCDSVVSSNTEAPPTTDIPNDQASVLPPDKQHLGRHIRVTNGGAPFCAQKQPSSARLSNEGFDGNGSSNSGVPAKKKRKLWTKEEDMELIAAVEKFGEGNWANILKGDFKHDRTATQLSQRWAIIRKRQTPTKEKSTSNKSRSEEMLAAQKAFSMALNMPMSGNLSTILSGGTQLQTSNSFSSMAAGGTVDESHATSATQQINQNQETLCHKGGALNPSNKTRPTQKNPPAQPNPSICCPNPLIKAAAFAAGGRIATPSTAASLFKAAQSKNAVRIRHGGSSPSSTAATSTPPTTAVSITGTHSLNPRFIHPSVSLMSSGGAALITSKLCQVQAGSGKAASLPTSTSTQKLSSCVLQENPKRRRGIIISAIDVDELLAEETVVHVTENGSSAGISTSEVCNGNETHNDTSLVLENDEIQRKKKKLKEEESGEAKSGSNEAIKLNSGDSMAKGISGDEGLS